jgi:hypothetical protein
LKSKKLLGIFFGLMGKGTKKKHVVRWEWCHTEKLLGGLGLKDLKLQGISLSAKWLFHSLEADEPWKVHIRRNIERGIPRKAKSWKNIPFCDIIMGDFPITVQGSVIFKTIWKA